MKTLRAKLEAEGFRFAEPSMTELLNIVREHAAGVARSTMYHRATHGTRIRDTAIDRAAKALEVME